MKQKVKLCGDCQNLVRGEDENGKYFQCSVRKQVIGHRRNGNSIASIWAGIRLKTINGKPICVCKKESEDIC